MRAGDYFSFRYNPETRSRLGSFAHHCFEGSLVAVEEDGELVLRDTYWSIDGRQGSGFTPEQAQTQGTLTFMFNINDVDPIKEQQANYYDDVDVFCVSKQHACVPGCSYYFLRKGAVKSQTKMRSVVLGRMRDAEQTIDWQVGVLQRLAVERQRIEEGRLDEVYL